MIGKRVYRLLFVAALLVATVLFFGLKSGSFAIGRSAETGARELSPALPGGAAAVIGGGSINTVNATATVTAPASVPLGQSFNFDVQFANASGITGYGPYVNLFMPSSGVDGNDGYTFNGATYLSAPVTTTTLSCPSGGSVVSPLTGLSVTCPVTPSGQPSQLIILQLPFGSVTPGQQISPIQVSATMSNLADVGTPLPISAQAGFIFGDSPTGMMSSQGATNTVNVTPSLLMVAKSYNGPESETATGPNYPRSYIITPSMPPGVTASNVMVTDTLPDNIVYLGVTGSGFTTNTQPPIGSVVTSPNNQLKVTYTSFTGTASSVTVNFYVAQNNSGGSPVVNPTSGAAGTTANQAAAMGSWIPIDPRDGTTAQTINATSNTVTITDRSLAIQKSVSNATPPASPGDVLTYRLDFQVSDFFSMKNIIVMDTLGDGQDYDAGSATLNVTDRNGNVTGTFPAGNITVQNNVPAAGQTKISFDISAAMVAMGAADGTLQGGRAILPNAVAAQGFITFNATVRDTYKAPPMGPLLSGDTLGNSTIATGDVVPNNNITAPTTGTVTDGSSTSVVLMMPNLQKSVYAINGNTTIPNPVTVTPGDLVTFRLRYNLPSGDYKGTVITDTLPLPMFKAETLTNLAFNNINTGIPATGNAQFGPANSGAPFVTLPTITTSPSTANNQIIFTFPNNTDVTNTPTTIDLLFTLTATSDPFVDPLLFANQVNGQTLNSLGQIQNSAVVSPLIAGGPKLKLRKGVVAADNPAGIFAPAPPVPTNVAVNPVGACAGRLTGAGLPVTSATLGTNFNSNLSNVDAADQVTYSIVIENSGSGPHGAFNVSLTDTIPLGSTLVPGSVCVNDGAGTAIAFTGALPGTITLTDSSPTQGALAQGVSFVSGPNSTGTNIAILTYTVTLAPTVTPRQNIDNTATITNYAAVSGGQNFTPLTPATDLTDTARVTIADPQRAKTLLGTEIANASPNPNGASQAVIGELLTYRVIVTIPEGATSNVSIADTLPAGLAFVDVTSVSLSAGLTTGNAISTGATPSNTTIANSGRNITFNLGNVTNANTNNAVAETVTIEYRAVVLNVTGNQSGTTLTNSAVVNFNGNALAAVSAAAVTVIEPLVSTAKTVSVAGSAAGATANGDAGDAVTFVVTLSQAVNSPDAFDVTLNDPIPAAITTLALTNVVDSAGVYSTANFSIVAGTLQTTAPINLISQNTARTITITVTGILASTVMPGQSFANVATTRWTSLNGSPGQRSTYNTSSTERTGADGVGGALNDYASSATATATVFPTNPTKSLVTTSESHTTNSSVAIGEIARFRLQVRLPEGSATNFQLRDNLPTGLQFLNDGTAKFAFVTNGGMGILSTTLDPVTAGCTGLSGQPAMIVLGDETNVAGIAPSCPLPDAAVSDNTTTNSDSYLTGTDPFFKFGNLVNTDSDTNLEYILVEFNALVLNEAGNVRGTNRDNNFSVFNNNSGTSIATSGNIRVTVVEPLFTITKTPSITMGDAGDVVKYTVVYTNSGTNTSTAFETQLTDALPAFLTLNPASVMATSSGSAATPVNNSTGNTINITVASIPTGGSVTVMYSATINANAPAGLIISNTANLSYSSLPGAGTPNLQPGNTTGTTTPGASGAANGERNGSGGVNNYSISASASVMVKTPTVAKLAPSPTSYAIGETVTYNILVTLPEGETRALNVLDDLPAGMSYISHAIISSAGSSGGLLANNYNGAALTPVLTPASPVDGDVLSFAFGNVTTAADNDATSNQFLIRIVARVNNVSGNVNGTSLTNVASATYTNPNTSTTATTPTSSQTVTVKEPRLQLVKSVNPPNPDCGGRVTYTLVISHTAASTATANDVVLSDVLPAGLTYVSGSLTLVSGTPAPGVFNEASGTINAQWTAFPLGSVVTITYQADVPNCPPGTINQMFNNTANLAWTSLAGSDPNERTGAGGINNYNASSSAKVTITRPSIVTAKINTPTSGTTLMPGDMVTYTITIQNAGNAPATAVVFTDAIPANTTYVANSTTLNGGALADSAGAMPFAAGREAHTPGEPSGVINNGETATIVFKVTINNPLPLGVTQVANEGIVSSANIPTTPTNTVTNPVTGNPILSLNKSVANLTRSNLVPVQSGDVLEYTVVVTNTGNLPATNVALSDAIPANTTYVAASTSLNTLGVADSVGQMPFVPPGVQISSPFAPNGQLNVGAGQAATMKFRVTVNAVLTPANTTQITNSATANGQGPNGALPPATGTVTKPVAGNPLLGATKSVVNLTNSSGAATPGDVLEYTIVVTNTGNIASTGTTLTDAIPANTIYLSGTTMLNGAALADSAGVMPFAVSGAINSPSAAAGVLNVGSINQATVKFRVQIVNPIPLGVTQITNQATTNGNGPGGPVGPTPSNPVTTPVQANPVLGAAKSVRNLTRATGTAQPGDVLEYTVTVTNTGDTASTATTLTDPIPTNTTYVANSTTLNGAATGNMPGPIPINSLGAPSGVLNVGVANAAIVTFRVTINNPFPPDVLNVVNQASTSGTGPMGPIGPAPSNVVTTPVGANPILSPIKSVTNLTRSNGSAMPGDVLEYSITVTNTGNTASTATTFSDAIPANTAYVANSTTLNGAAAGNMPGPISINSPGATAGVLNVGAGNAAIIRFRVTINNPLPPGVTELHNRGTVNGNGQGGTPLDPVPTNEVITPLAANPVLGITKSVVNLSRSNGTAMPGDVLEYTVTVTNSGNTASVNTTLSDAIPVNTTYVLGSTMLNGMTLADNGAAMPYATQSTVNSPGENIGQVNVGAGQAAIVKFRVTINNPLPPNITQVVNTAAANGEGPTGNPVGPVSPPPVVTPIGANPQLSPMKSVENLTRSNGTAMPGDILEYTVVIANTGNIAATSAVLTDAIPANTAYVPNTTTLNGTAVPDSAGPPVTMPYTMAREIHSPGAPTGQLNVGAGQAATVKFRVQIAAVIPAGVTTITNQATVNGNGPTGNPVGPVPSNPVVTPLLTNPMLDPTKTVANLSRPSGTAMPGDVLEYTITVTNTGNTPSLNTFINDPIPANTTYVAGSTMVNGTAGASITPGPLFINSPGAPAGQLNVGAINRAIVTFRVTIDNPLPPNVTTVSNTATVNGEGPGGNPVGPVMPPPVVTPVGANPILTPVKSVANLSRPSGTAMPGDILEYTIVVTNTGNIAATGVNVTDPIPGNTTYVANSTTLNGVAAANITAGPLPINSPGAPVGQLNVGAGQAATVKFRVTIDNPLPPNVMAVDNTASVNGNGPNGNPAGPVPSNTVTTPVGAAPVLVLNKSFVNLTRSGGTSKPGDVLKYTIVVTNNGNIAATNATLADLIPANTTYIAASTTLNGAATTNITSSPIAISSPGAPGGQLNVGAINAATVMFQVMINTPLPANTTQVANTATANANGPAGPVPPASDMVVAPVQGNPALNTLKSVQNLTRSGGTAQPGDVLEYTVVVTNTGDIPSTGTTFTDPIPLNTTYVAGSTTLNGAAAPNVPGPIAINSPGAPSGQVNVGAINEAVIKFRVAINNPFPPNVLEVVNQGSVSGNSPQGPVGPVDTNPVSTPVGANPILNAAKSVVNLTRSSGTAQPGDVLEFTIILTNTGNTASTSTTFTDPIPANTTYIASSTKLNGVAAPDMPGPIAVNSVGAPSGQLNVGAINQATVVFRVTINNPLPPNVTEVRNQGMLNGNGQGGAPLTPVPTNEVIIPLAANPILSPTKTVRNLTRSSGTALPGDVLEYTVVVENTGNIAATGATLSDAIPANTTYVAGTTTLNNAAIADNPGPPVMMPYAASHLINSPGAPAGQLNVGAVNAAVVVFRVTINNPLPPNVTLVSNTAAANGNGPTGNPVGPVSPPPVITPLGANPILQVAKSVANLTRTGTAQTGDTLEYTIRVENVGNISATGATVQDLIPANTVYMTGTTSLNGNALADVGGLMPYSLTAAINSPGAPSGQLDVGAANAAVVRYRVMINAVLPVGVTTITNTALANGNGPTGNPVGPVPSPPVVTPVATNPILEPAKTVANLSRASGPAMPGDVLEYTITVTNTGNTPATSASIFDPVPANTTYVAGSTTLNNNPAPDVPGPLAINSPGAPVGQLNVGAVNAAVVKFRVRINNPLPPNVTTVTNFLTSNGNGPGGPVGPVSPPPVITPVNASPILSPAKTFANLTRNGTAMPGDVLEYTIRVENTGNISATGATLTDAIPPNTTYSAGSTRLNGNPVSDAAGQMPYALGGAINSPGAPSGQLDAGTASAAIVVFRVTINNPLPPNITQVANTATANGNGPAGNPVGPVPAPPVITPITSMPVLSPAKSVINLTRSSGTARPGDVLEYTISIANTGNIVATGATLSDPIPANTTYVSGTTTVNGNASPDLPGPIAINSPGAPTGQLNVGAAQAAVVKFRVTINTPLPLGVSQIVNQATANGNGPGGPVPPAPSNPVVTPVTGNPLPGAAKSVINLSRSNGTAQPGDVLEYTIIVTNSGDASSTGTTLLDPIPVGTTYISGSTTLNGAVAPNMPGPIAINSPGAAAGVLNVGAINAATVRFRVTINTPFPAGQAEIINQASVSGNGPGGPIGPVPSNPVATPVGANPQLTASKSVQNLSRSSGTAQPGDVLLYTIIITNTGNTASINTTFTDPIPANTTFVGGSTVVNGNAAPNMPGPITIQSLSAPAGQVNVGAANQVTIRFRLTINNPLPPNVTEVRNQGTVSGNGAGGPISPVPTNEVITPIGGNPVLMPAKSVINLTRSSGAAMPGDLLQYTITVANTGNIAATGATLTDAIPANTTYVTGSTTLNTNAVADSGGPPVTMPFANGGAINSPGAPIGQLNVGAGQAATVVFQVTINNPLPPNITLVSNTATANGNGPSGNPVGPVPAPPVITPVGAQPVLSPAKSVINLSRSSGPAQPGDVLEYTVSIANTGNIAATGVTLSDPIPLNTTYVAGSTTLNGVATTNITPGPITINSPGAPIGQVNVGAMQAAVVAFRVTINSPVPVGVTTVSNTATVNGNGPAGPVGPVQTPPVITPLLTNPVLGAAKSVINLSRSAGAAMPGDVLEYTITVTNTGNTAATGVTVSDPIPANTTYIAASTRLNGNQAADITAGPLPVNSPGASAGVVNVGAGQTAVVTFQVTINFPLPLGVTSISNTVTANGNGPGGPVGPVTPPPVITPVGGNPVLTPAKSVVNLSRVSGSAMPGDVLEYTVRVENTGNTTATNASLSDPIPANTTYVLASTTLNSAAVADNGSMMPYAMAHEIHSPGASSGQLNVGATQAAIVKFRVTINNPLPPNVTQVTNVATVNGDGPQGPIGPVQPSPVVTPVGALPVLATIKSVANLTRSGGTARPGDVLEYTITVTNTGNIAAANSTLSDAIPANTTYVAGSTRLNNNAAPDIANGAIVINSPGELAGFINAGAANAAVVMFRVTINNPFPENVTQIINMATANAQGPNGQPIGAPSNPVVTPVGANPLLVPVKGVVNLTRPTGTAMPDDVLEYTITVTNNGDTASTGTMLNDPIPSNTTYVPGSTTLNGGATLDISPGPIPINSPGAVSGRVNVGGAAAAVVKFRVRIVNPLPAGVTQIVNQASVSGNGPGGPIGSINSNPVITPVGATPLLTPVKSVANLTRGNDLAQPGDLLEYAITVINSGNTASTGTMLRDSIPANTTYVANSTTLNGGPAQNMPGPVSINSPGAPTGQLNTGANQAAIVRFRVTINHPLPAGVSQIVNQASVSGNGPGGPIGPVDSNPVTTPVGATPILSAVKSVVDVNGGQAGTGDILEYAIVITNNGSTTSVNTSFSDAIPQYTVYVPGSTQLNGLPAPDITIGALTINSPGAPPGHLWVGATNAATVRFRVRIVDSLPLGATQIRNQGTVNGNGQNGSLPPTDTNPVITPLGTDLTISKTHTGNFTIGSAGQFTLTVRNLGPNSTFGLITVTDVLPTGLSYISATGNGWVCNAAGQNVTCTTQQSITAGANSTPILMTVGVQPNAPATIINTAVVIYDGDLNTTNNTASDTVLIDNGLSVPGSTFPPGSPVSDQKPGSLLIFPVYTSDAVNSNRENTRLSITNIDPKVTAYLHIFFIDGATCAVADQFLCLTPNQTTSFLASDVDPGVTGYVTVVAVDEAGCPISFNRLLGYESVKFATGHFGEVAAESFSALYNGRLPGCTSGANIATLNLDGVQYNQPARVVGLSGLPSPNDNNSTLLVLSRTGGNLATGASTLGGLTGLLYDDREASFSFTATIGACQLKQVLSNNFPRTAPRLTQVIPAGHTGWVKLWTANDAGLIGVAFNYNPDAKVSSSVYNGGYSLHKLRLANDSYTMPVFPPSCR